MKLQLQLDNKGVIVNNIDTGWQFARLANSSAES